MNELYRLSSAVMGTVVTIDVVYAAGQATSELQAGVERAMRHKSQAPAGHLRRRDAVSTAGRRTIVALCCVDPLVDAILARSAL